MENIKKLMKNFDVISYLEDRNIAVTESGKNVGKGWIGIQCMFCPDSGNHLGIRLKENTFSCFKCKTSGSILSLIKEVDAVDFKKAKEILPLFQKDTFFYEDEEKEPIIDIEKNDNILPREFKKIIKGEEPLSVKKYFKRRKFPLQYAQKYQAGYCRTGKYAYHMILPIFMYKKLVSFIAVDLLGTSKLKYVFCPNEIALVNKSDLVYGFDEIKNADKIYIVEGVTDKWRVGKNAIALLTNKCSTSLLLKIKSVIKSTCKIVVLLDIDAKRNAEKLSSEIKSIFFSNEVLFIEIEKKDHAKDPDLFSKKQLKFIHNL